MRNSLGYTGKKDSMKRDDSSINVEISLRDAVVYDLDATVIGQGFSEFLYESGKNGNMSQMYEYKLVKDKKSKKWDDITHRESQSRKRKVGGVDRELLQAMKITPRVISTARRRRARKTYVSKKRLESPKTARFGNTQFMVRCESVGLRNLKCR